MQPIKSLWEEKKRQSSVFSNWMAIQLFCPQWTKSFVIDLAIGWTEYPLNPSCYPQMPSKSISSLSWLPVNSSKHLWVFLLCSSLTHCSFIMPKLHLPWFCLLTHLQSLHYWHLMLVSGFASNLSMYHYFSTWFLCLWSLQWYFFIEMLSVSLAVHIF